jgi:uncharacterized lipoprotein
MLHKVKIWKSILLLQVIGLLAACSAVHKIHGYGTMTEQKYEEAFDEYHIWQYFMMGMLMPEDWQEKGKDLQLHLVDPILMEKMSNPVYGVNPMQRV